MLARLLACTFLLAVLGCLMVGCSDDTRRITSPATTIQTDPLSTSIEEAGTQVDVVSDGDYPFDPWNENITDDEDVADPDDPMNRFDDESDNHEPLGRE